MTVPEVMKVALDEASEFIIKSPLIIASVVPKSKFLPDCMVTVLPEAIIKPSKAAIVVTLRAVDFAEVFPAAS